MLYRMFRSLALLLDHRRNRWVEISLTRAWSHDLPPRLFDLKKL